MEIGRLHVLSNAGHPPVMAAKTVAAAGAPVFQLRMKGLADGALHALAEQVARACAAGGAELIVNDRVDIALAVEAAGVHLGADDLPVAVARRLAGRRMHVGGTVRDADDARRAEDAGASYLGVGPAYATTTKTGLPEPLGPARIGEIAAAVAIPIIAIGGVTTERVPELVDAGAHGVAVVAAVWSATEPTTAIGELLSALGDRQ